MAFVTNVLILEPIVYCALFVKEDKTGTEEEVCTIMQGSYLLYIMRVCKNGVKPHGNITETYLIPSMYLHLNSLRVTLGISTLASVDSV